MIVATSAPYATTAMHALLVIRAIVTTARPLAMTARATATTAPPRAASVRTVMRVIRVIHETRETVTTAPHPATIVHRHRAMTAPGATVPRASGAIVTSVLRRAVTTN